MSLQHTSDNASINVAISDCDPSPAPVWTATGGTATVTVAPDGLSASFVAPATIPDTTGYSVAYKRSGVDRTDTVAITFIQGAGGTGGLSFQVG